jgi:hypothetical protein
MLKSPYPYAIRGAFDRINRGGDLFRFFKELFFCTLVLQLVSTQATFAKDIQDIYYNVVPACIDFYRNQLGFDTNGYGMDVATTATTLLSPCIGALTTFFPIGLASTGSDWITEPIRHKQALLEMAAPYALRSLAGEHLNTNPVLEGAIQLVEQEVNSRNIEMDDNAKRTLVLLLIAISPTKITKENVE